MTYTMRRIEEYNMIEASKIDKKAKEMSVKELVFLSEITSKHNIVFKYKDNKLLNIINGIGEMWRLDRNQAHLLYLYLQEHLNV